MTYKHRNGRLVPRNGSGQFRKATMQDIGIGGVCKVCSHFLLRHYDGDLSDEFPDPRKFVYRCFTCNPLTEQEKEIRQTYENGLPKPTTFQDIFRGLAEQEKK